MSRGPQSSRLTRAGTVLSDWAACSSPKGFDLSGQPDGTYTFSARARDAAGNTGSPASSDYQLDTTGAAVQIDSGPGAAGNDRSPDWSFSAESGASFECRLARAATPVSDWAPCSSPRNYDLSAQPDGSYTFSVRARDAQSNQGVPVSSDYQLDTVAPGAPSIDSGPPSPSRDRAPIWSFSGEGGAAFQCRVDGAGGLVADWRGCASPRRFDLGGRGDGRYTLTVRATDAAGNTGPGGSHGFELDTTPPSAPTFSNGPGDSGHDATPRWSFDAEDGAALECRLSREGHALADWAPCASPKTFDLASEPDGHYSLAVRATDAAGNVGAPGSSGYELSRAVDDKTKNAVQPDRQSPAGHAPPDVPQPERGPAGGDGGPAAASTPNGPLAPSGDDKAPAGNGEAAAGDSATVTPDGPNHDLAPGAGIPEKAAAKVLKTIGRVARAVARHADDSVFPGLLLIIVMGFFAVQNRIDRNDPKLRLAPAFADPDLEFRPQRDES